MQETIQILTDIMERQHAFYNSPRGQEYLKSEAARRAENLRIRKLNYQAKLKHYQDSPDHVVEMDARGFKAWPVGSPQAKAILAAQRKDQREAEAAQYEAEHPLEMVLETLMYHEEVTRAQIRVAMDEYLTFSVEKMNEVISILEEEGIAVV